MWQNSSNKAFFHLPGLFEFFDFYSIFLPLFFEHREYFYDWCRIGSIYGAPCDCLWGGGRTGLGNYSPEPQEVLNLIQKYGISGRLTFSNSLLKEEHLSDKKCNSLCKAFANSTSAVQAGAEVKNGIILYSDLLLDYISKNYSNFYFVSSTTKVLTDFDDFEKELNRTEFKFVVPDFRLNKTFTRLSKLSDFQKNKVEFLCNECCWFGCYDRKNCYKSVSLQNLGISLEEHKCCAPLDSSGINKGYSFFQAMKNPAFIGVEDIQKTYMPMGFSNFKIEGRGLGSAMLLEFLLYYMTKPEFQLKVREEIYLDSMLDLF